MRYRLGRSHQDIVYRQLGDEPSDEDPRVAVFTDTIEAIAVAALLNGEQPRMMRSRFPRPVGRDISELAEHADEPVVEPPPVDALLPLAPNWTRPASTEAHNIASVLAAPQRTVPANDFWDERPFVAWQAAAIQQVMYRAIDDAHAAGVAEGRRQATEERAKDEREHRVDVTEKGCLGVGPGHGWGKPHFWRCSTPGCMGHMCRTEAVAG